MILALLNLIRYRTTLKFALATVSSLLIVGSDISLSAVHLLLFAGSSSAFGFAVNDISDSELDKMAMKNRNPIAAGKISKKRGFLYSAGFLLFSLFELIFLSFENQLMGITVILLFYTYSFIVRAKSKPILDILYHAGCLSILAFMGYIQYRPIDISCILLVLTIFFISAMSEILQEVRDHDSDRKMIITTAISLGKTRALKLGLIFFSAICIMFAISAVLDIIPQPMILLFPLAYLIAKPIVDAIKDEDSHNKMTRDIGVRAPLIMITLIVTFILLNVYK